MDISEFLQPFLRSSQVLALWLLNLVLMLAVGASFAWGSIAYLRFADTRESRKRLLAVSVYVWLSIAIAAILLWPQPVTALLMIGAGLFVLGLALFFGAVIAHRDRPPAFAFVNTPPQSFVCRGPYRFVRHPIYTAYLLTFLGLACLSKIPIALLAVVYLGYLYFVASREEERSFRDSPYAADYEAYLARTGMFVPRCRQLIPKFPQSRPES
jgi:protein-S-isoprenylcysteine O-methyltransferase Ste14